MHVISRKKLKDFWEAHPDCEHALRAWFKIIRTTRYAMWADLKHAFGAKVDKVNDRIVFDIGGNKCRVITIIHFSRGKLYVRDVLTHPQYDREGWKHG